MGERWNEVKDAVVEEQRDYNRQQKTAFQQSRKWFLGVPVVIGVGFLIALVGSGALDTAGALVMAGGVVLLFVALWKHVDAGGDDFGASTGAAFGGD